MSNSRRTRRELGGAARPAPLPTEELFEGGEVPMPPDHVYAGACPRCGQWNCWLVWDRSIRPGADADRLAIPYPDADPDGNLLAMAEVMPWEACPDCQEQAQGGTRHATRRRGR